MKYRGIVVGYVVAVCLVSACGGQGEGPADASDVPGEAPDAAADSGTVNPCREVSCDDGDPCNGDEFCDPKSGACVPGTPPDLDDKIPCTLDECDGELSRVVHLPRHDQCDDANPCTHDECDAVSGCLHVPTDGACDDGDECTQGDACQAGVCTGGEWTCGDACGNGLLPPGVAEPATGYGVLAQCPGYSLEVSLLAPGILRTRYAEPGQAAGSPSYAVVGEFVPDFEYSHGADGDTLHLCTPALAVELAMPDCRLTVRDSQGAVLLEDGEEGGWSTGVESLDGADHPVRRLTRMTPADEIFYGFGERTGGLDKRGRTLTFWNTDNPAYPSDADPLYQSIPFFMGLRDGVAYGIFLDNTWRLLFDMADSQADRYRLTAFGGQMDQYLFTGPAIRDVLQRYALVTGTPALPPRWTLGYHQARWSYYPDDRVVEICQEFRDRAIPADGIWLDIDYMEGFRSFTWDPVGFPDPTDLVQTVADLGFKTTVIIDPGLKQDPSWDIYQQGVTGEHFLLDTDGFPFVGEVWPGDSVFPDFTQAKTREWWGGLVPRVTDHGVLGIWLDMNEPANFLAQHNHTVPGDVIAAGDGHPTSMDGIHNVYALVENRATWDGLRAALPDRRPFLLTRAGFAGIQRYAAVWTGDAPSTFDGLSSVLPMLVGLGLSGVPFVGSDVGGWSGGATPELFARWIEVGAISPFFRGHVATDTPDQEPWAFGVEVEEISRIHIRERYRLLPYLYTLMAQAARTGLPVLRALAMEFQDDATTYTLSQQAMLGPWLLFAPAVEEGQTQRTLYLPAGRWLEFHSGALYEGPKHITVNLSLQALPVFLREGAILPRGPALEWSDQAPTDPLTLDLFPDASTSTFNLYEDAGDGHGFEAGEYSSVTYTLEATATGAVLGAAAREGDWEPPARRLVTRCRPVDQDVGAVTLDQEALPELADLAALDGAEQGWFHDPNDRSLWVVFADRAPFTLEMTYDPAPAEAAQVLVPVQVSLPPGTPTDTPIHIATSAADWSHQPLEWGTKPDTAVGLVPVPRGAWFEYKYTRGDWSTVEKWGGCLEADNRYAFGKAHPVKEDVVEVWADTCN